MLKGRLKYIVIIAVAFLLTPIAVEQAYEARQALHFGGEWLLVPLGILLSVLYDSFVDFISIYKEKAHK